METGDGDTRRLTLDEAIALANRLQQDGHLAPARQLYDGVLDVQPHHADALHFSGVLAHHEGRSDDAVALIERSLTLSPDRADYHSNLGIVLQSLGRTSEAIDAYRRAIALDPRHANAHSNLGILLRANGQNAEAEAEYREAIACDPAHVDAHTNLGVLLNRLGRAEEAAACFCRAITLRPKHSEARRLLALAHCMLGETGEAVHIFDEWLAEEPGDPVARHLRAACTGDDVPDRASNAFVEQTFDRFAASFEAKLAKLFYRAPALVTAMLEDAGVSPAGTLDVLDVGCGTGLCASLLAPYARTLTGVDLSEGMLAHAREKGVYQALVRAELTEYLLSRPAAFDVIVSADTLVYFGDLSPVLGAAARALRPGGLLIFTLERAKTDGGAYRLELHGRYSHSQAYVERILGAEGLASRIECAELRLEAGAAVPGLVIRATKQ